MNIVIDIDNKKLTSKITREDFKYIFPFANLKIYNNVFEYSLIGTVFKMDYPSRIFVYFKNNNIIKLSIFSTKERIDSIGFNLEKSYNDYNETLERSYGKKIFNMFRKNKIWHFKDAILKHYLFERFCMEEEIEVCFKNNKFIKCSY